MDPKELHKSRGSGIGSRVAIDLEKLRAIGWSVTSRTSQADGKTKTFFTYKNPEGKTFKSTKAVEAELKMEATSLVASIFNASKKRTLKR